MLASASSHAAESCSGSLNNFEGPLGNDDAEPKPEDASNSTHEKGLLDSLLNSQCFKRRAWWSLLLHATLCILQSGPS